MTFWHRGIQATARALRLDLTHGQKHYAGVLARYVTPGIRWLEVGCGRQIVPPWGATETEQQEWVARSACLVGIDLDSAIREHPHLSARAFATAPPLPFGDAVFDLVTANMVVEHVADCPAFLRDIRRVLKPGGRFLFHTPNHNYYLVRIASWLPGWIKSPVVWLLERRREQDRFETHYRMNTPRTIAALAGQTGFDVELLQTISGCGSFGALGPVGLLEIPVLKLNSLVGCGKLDHGLIGVLAKPAHPGRQ